MLKVISKKYTKNSTWSEKKGYKSLFKYIKLYREIILKNKDIGTHFKPYKPSPQKKVKT